MTCCLQMHLDDNRVIAALARENHELKTKVASLEEAERRTKRWLREMKDQAGVGENVSIDKVWADALAALKLVQSAGK
jgi:predicted LPLAT superfamily acyltransferase